MSAPTKPLSIASPRRRVQDIEDQGPDTPQDARTQLRNQYGTPPVGTTIPRFRATPGASTPLLVGSPSRNSSGLDVLRNTPRTASPLERGIVTPQAQPEAAKSPPPAQELSDEDKIKVLQRHLVTHKQRAGDEATPSADPTKGSPAAPILSGPSSKKTSRAPSVHSTEGQEPFPLPYTAPGGDITHEVYKWQERARRNARPRANSLTLPRPVDPAFENIHEPGGFRRNYMLRRANEAGDEEPTFTNHFIDFLYIFGHFAGEDLEEDEEDEEDDGEEDEESRPVNTSIRPEPNTSSILRRGNTQTTIGSTTLRHAQRPLSPGRLPNGESNEETPLLVRDESQTRIRTRSLSRSRRNARSSHGPHHGDATVTQAVLMLLKAFIGTGILFMGKAFYNGGMLFSLVTLVFIALVSLYSFLLLVETKMVVPGSFGEIGGALYGKPMRRLILTSIVVSQLGFVCAYTIFVAENLQAFILAVTKGEKLVPIQFLIFGQITVFLPFAMIRNLAKLSFTALIADVFILIGVVYIASNEFVVLSERGVADIRMFNENDFPLLIGTAVFAFEGIGLVIPITDSMKEPKKFPAVLTGVMFFLIFLFGGAGILSYAAYGSKIETVVIKNLPQDQSFVQVVQFLYSLAILLSAPLQLFPALRIMENWIFRRQSGKRSLRVKWTKNAFRMVIVILCYFISWAGARDLDKFVSFVGSFACVPLCFVYPAMLHIKAVAKTRWQKAADWLMMIFGTIAAFYTTSQTIRLMVSAPGEGVRP